MPLIILLLLCLAWAGCVDEPPPADERTADSWFIMSEQFTPSGFIGEGAERNVVKVYIDRCPKRASGALGSCYTFDYRPKFLPPMPKKKGFIGAVWQSPPNNWGDQPPKVVKAGGKRVTFKVRGSRAGIFKVSAGGIGLDHPFDGKMYAYQDKFATNEKKIAFDEKAWHVGSLKLIDNFGKPIFGDRKELGILGPFIWAVEVDGKEPITVYIDDIIWDDES